MDSLKKDQIVLFLFRVRLGDENDPNKVGHFITIGKLFKINNSKIDFNRLYEHLKALLSVKDQSYTNLPILEIVFSYKILPLDSKVSKTTISSLPKKIKQKASTYKFRGYNLPTTMNYKLWGTILSKTDQKVIIKKKGSQYIYNIEIINIENEPLKYNVTLNLPTKETFLSFTDIINNDFNNLNSFIRYVGSNEYYFINGILELKFNPRKTSNLELLNLNETKSGKKIIQEIDNKILTLDIETQVINGIIKPILISIYDGFNHYNFYLPDFNSIDKMIFSSLNILLDPRYDKYKIYVHNLSNFDGIFLLKYLVNLKYNDQNVFVEPTMKDGKMINLDIKFDKYKISFRDSLLILLASLSKLAKAFEVEAKGEFDFKSVNNLNVTELNEYSLRNELIAYATLDCKILFDILIKFNQLIFDLYKLNINRCPTLPSLAFAIFRSKYLSTNTVPLITGQIFNDINQSYTGGSVDMIIPHGFNIYHYDINSLYPYSMKTFDMPVTNIKSFEGDILKFNPEALGFFEAIIHSPKDLNVPILQIHDKGRTISPLGCFSGWFFSEELRNAKDKFGYDFEVLRGYTFDRLNIFKNYVSDLYNLRVTYPKSHPMNYIAKILMNSLYGRFGLKPILSEFVIIDNNELDGFIDTGEINDLIILNDKYLLSFINNNKKHCNLQKSIASTDDLKSNIAIASATTAYSRIVLAEIKKYCIDNNIKLFYFDTDSVFTNKPLPDYLIGKDIGQWKLEAFCREAIFIAPKVYGYVTQDGKEVVKCKGFKNKLTFNDLKSLLIKDNKLLLHQEKWFSSLEKGDIKILEQLYTLMATSNKRNFIFNKNNLLVNTYPYTINTKTSLNK